jgi:hypothetical protein
VPAGIFVIVDGLTLVNFEGYVVKIFTDGFIFQSYVLGTRSATVKNILFVALDKCSFSDPLNMASGNVKFKFKLFVTMEFGIGKLIGIRIVISSMEKFMVLLSAALSDPSL